MDPNKQVDELIGLSKECHPANDRPWEFELPSCRLVIEHDAEGRQLEIRLERMLRPTGKQVEQHTFWRQGPNSPWTYHWKAWCELKGIAMGRMDRSYTGDLDHGTYPLSSSLVGPETLARINGLVALLEQLSQLHAKRATLQQLAQAS